MEECFVCFEETNKFITFECGHKMCETCFPKLRSSFCPICNEIIKVYRVDNLKWCCCVCSSLGCLFLVFSGIYPYF